VAGERVYRSDDRGETWAAVSGDLTRNLDPTQIPIMGKVWPTNSVAFNQATTQLSTITVLDESPLLEGLLYVGTHDGLLQITEDGGKNWTKVEKLPGLPEYTFVTDIFASSRDVSTVFATFNNYQRGDFKPYVYKSTNRGKTWTSIAGNLPQRSGAWSIVQDHINGNLLFAGMEFGVWFTVDGGSRWTQLKGGIPTTQARDLHIQRRESDLVVGTFGRGAYILDDYSALRALTPQSLAEEARLFPLRDAYRFNELSHQQAAWGNVTTPNPPYGAVFTYHVGQAPAADTKLVLTIADDTGKPFRRLDLQTAPGLYRLAWNLRGETPAGQGRGGRGALVQLDRETEIGRHDREVDSERHGREVGQAERHDREVGQAERHDREVGQAERHDREVGTTEREEEQDEPPPTFGGRGGPEAPLAAPGRYRATLGKMAGDVVTPIGEPQTFQVVPLRR
jgi:hypothetical protein